MGASAFKTRITKRRNVRDRLLAYITSSERAPGERLAPMQRLAELFDTSVRTVHQAVKTLESEGYVETRHGSGTFVTSRYKPLTLADAVILCMQGRGHVWADLAGLFMDALGAQGKLAMLWDVSSPAAQNTLARRLAHAEARTLIVSPYPRFPYDVLDLPGFPRKTVIGLLRWTGPIWPGLHRVLTDGDAGGRLLADHLWQAGHRRLLIVGTAEEIAELDKGLNRESVPGPSLSAAWRKRGGHYRTLASTVPEPVATFEEARFAAIFRSPSAAPTAIVGLRDMEAWSAQWLLARIRPDLADRVAIAGYYDTPWSLAGRPAFTSVSLAPENLVAACLDLMRASEAGTLEESTVTRIRPRLVVR